MVVLAAGTLALAAAGQGCGPTGGGNGDEDAAADGGDLDGDLEAGTWPEASVTDGDTDTLPTNCGNQVIDTGEVCDDGNNISGDGCNATCTQEDEDDLQANVFVASNQLQVEAGSRGAYGVAVWTDNSARDGDSSCVSVRLFGPDGAPKEAQGMGTPEFIGNSTFAGSQHHPAVGVGADGRFVVAWVDDSGTAGGGPDIRARLFDADGTPRVNNVNSNDLDFVVHTSVAGNQSQPAVAVDPNFGYFIVVWTDDSAAAPDTSGTAVRARVFDPDGTAQNNPDVGSSNEFVVNSNYGNNQSQPAVAADVNGNWAVVWTDGSGWADGAPNGISGALLGQVGNNVSGGDISVNSTTAGDQNTPSVASQGMTGFVVMWTDGSGSGDTSFTGIRGRLFHSDGSPRQNDVGGNSNDFLVNTLTTGRQQAPSVAVHLTTQQLFAVWQDGSGTDGHFAGIRGRVFGVSASPMVGPWSTDANDFVINTTTWQAQMNPAVVIIDPIGMVFWEDESAQADDNDGWGIRFRVVGLYW